MKTIEVNQDELIKYIYTHCPWKRRVRLTPSGTRD